MKLTDTVEMMESIDYKERFRAEYFQLDNRVNGLRNMLEKYLNGTLEFTPSCNYELLECQYRHMQRYKECLIKRAEIEGISLYDESPKLIEGVMIAKVYDENNNFLFGSKTLIDNPKFKEEN